MANHTPRSPIFRLSLLGAALLASLLGPRPAAYAAEPPRPPGPPPAPASPPPKGAIELEVETEGEEADLKDAHRQLKEATEKMVRIHKQRFFGGGPRLGVLISDAKDGVRVDGVTPNSAAQKAGLRTNDLLTAINGQSVAGEEGMMALMRRIRETKPNAEITLDYLRDGKKQQVKVKLPEASEMPLMPDLPRDLEFRMGSHGPFGGGPFAGIELAALNPDLAQYFGAKEGMLKEGVLVVSAPADEKLKLKGGDVLLKIGDRVPKNPSQAMRILRSYEPGEKLTLEVLRQKQKQSLTVELPAPPKP